MDQTSEYERLQTRPGARAASKILRQLLVANHDLEKALGHHLDVNATDLEAMQHLIVNGVLSPTDLAARLGVSTAAATLSVDRLVKVGHVTREPHPSDRRKQLVVPAPASLRKAMNGLMPMIQQTDALLDEFTEEQQDAITDYLARALIIVQNNVERIEAEG